jgi:hypothetical protein
VGDPVHEGDETFFVELSEGTVVGFADSRAVAAIRGDDPVISIEDASRVETDSGNPAMQFTVRLSQNPLDPVTVHFGATDGTATAGVDYQSESGTLTFSDGTARTISIPAIGDTRDELDETLHIVLSNANDVPILNAEGRGTITDDDHAAISVGDVAVQEGFHGWVNSRTWEGVYWVTPMTGESYHEMRISGAVAASVNEGAVGVALQSGWVADVLAVTELTPTASGFVVQLSREVDPAVLNLNDVASGAPGPVDVSLTGATVGTVGGSLVLEGQSPTFLASGGPLPADEYTVRFRSANDGWKRVPSGQLLDGEFDGVPGGDCVRSLAWPGPAGMVVGLPDFTRGPGQVVQVPAADASGIPLTVNDAAGVYPRTTPSSGLRPPSPRGGRAAFEY